MVTKTATCIWTTKRVLCVLSIVCLVLRLSHISYERYQANQSNQVYQPFESEIIARNIVDGKGYSFPYYGHLIPTANAPPGIVFVLAAIYAFKLPNPTLVFQLLQVAVNVLSMLLTWSIAERTMGRSVAWFAVLLFIFDINISYSTIWIQETAFNILFTLSGVWALLRLSDRRTFLDAVVAGLLFGLGILVRPTIGSIFLVSWIWLIVQWYKAGNTGFKLTKRPISQGVDFKRSSASSWQLSMCVLFAAVITVTPWTIRNAWVFGKLIPVSQNLGLSLWYGNNPKASGSQVDRYGRDLVPEGDMLESLKMAKNEVELDQIYRDQALDYVLNNPRHSFLLRLKCFAYYWLDHNYWIRGSSGGDMDVETRHYSVPWWLFSGNILLVLFAALAFFWSCTLHGSTQLLTWVIASSCFTCTMIHADLGNRYRLQIEPFLLILISGMLLGVFEVVRKKCASLLA